MTFLSLKNVVNVPVFESWSVFFWPTDPLVRGTDPRIRIRIQNVTDPQHYTRYWQRIGTIQITSLCQTRLDLDPAKRCRSDRIRIKVTAGSCLPWGSPQGGKSGGGHSDPLLDVNEVDVHCSALEHAVDEGSLQALVLLLHSHVVKNM